MSIGPLTRPLLERRAREARDDLVDILLDITLIDPADDPRPFNQASEVIFEAIMRGVEDAAYELEITA